MKLDRKYPDHTKLTKLSADGTKSIPNHTLQITSDILVQTVRHPQLVSRISDDMSQLA